MPASAAITYDRSRRAHAMIKLVLLLFCATVLGEKYKCNYKSAAVLLKRPTYEFSTKLLDRVAQDTDGHFVYSPMSTWIQLLALADGATGATAVELRNVTRYNKFKCFRRKWRLILNKIDAELEPQSKRKSFMVIDKLMDVKRFFIREVKWLRSMEVLLLNFQNEDRAASLANQRIARATNGVVSEIFSPDDFKSTIMLMADAAYYRNSWNIPFDPVYTSLDTFYGSKYTDQVYMMTRVGHFNMSFIPQIGVKVLELPCGSDGRVSMLVFVPTRGSALDIYYNLRNIRLMSIFNIFRKDGVKLVRVKLPRFKITTDIDNIPELLFDMGINRIFYPDLANLKGISNYKVYASLMTQVADIEVTEKGVRASAIAEFLLYNKTTANFIVDRPFAFMLIDRKYEVILFSGMYSEPHKY